ncbi:hypothetical protein TorRG33x02_036610 [Trema orientale]|uniref:Uncharacterized protein n=1 Tax=Trema orientale TaxID=63057 RepID=A0A2P5FS09_TREOI|nr:hypothetical protein TorRG33x02_036610 [Trema orientale]
MSELARVALLTMTLSEIGASRARIVVLPRVPPPGLLTRVSVRTLGPVMGPPPGATPYLELEHPELIARVRVDRRVRFPTRNVRVRVDIWVVRRRQVRTQRRQGFLKIVRRVVSAIAVRVDRDAAQRKWRVHLSRWIFDG